MSLCLLDRETGSHGREHAQHCHYLSGWFLRFLLSTAVVSCGTSDTASSSMRSIKTEYRALGATVKGSGAQVVFSSVKRKGIERAIRICQINKWLQDWCHRQGFGYLDHGTCFEKLGLLGADGVQLSEKGKSIFSHRLAELVKRALN